MLLITLIMGLLLSCTRAHGKWSVCDVFTSLVYPCLQSRLIISVMSHTCLSYDDIFVKKVFCFPKYLFCFVLGITSKVVV